MLECFHTSRTLGLLGALFSSPLPPLFAVHVLLVDVLARYAPAPSAIAGNLWQNRLVAARGGVNTAPYQAAAPPVRVSIPLPAGQGLGTRPGTGAWTVGTAGTACAELWWWSVVVGILFVSFKPHIHE
jgi:hypothetical protein